LKLSNLIPLPVRLFARRIWRRVVSALLKRNLIQLRFVGPADESFVFNVGDQWGDACVARALGLDIANFETISYPSPGTVIHIDHFAVTGEMRGLGLGELCLRQFAAVAIQKKQNVVTLHFEVHRMVGDPTPAAVQSVAVARQTLFQNVGMTNTSINPTNQNRCVVKGDWHRASW